MSDNKVFVFGSFTEDETRSLLQRQPTAPADKRTVKADIQFGSLNLAAGSPLSSVGGKVKVLKKGSTDELVGSRSSNIPEKVGKVEDSSNTYSSRATEHCKENGISKHHALDSSSNNNVGPITDNVSLDSLHISDRESSSLYQDSSFHLLDADILEEGNGVSGDVPIINNRTPSSEHVVAVKNFVPRGLINAGNLCFLNATLQALFSCTPFVQLLVNLQGRDIPKAGFPTLTALTEFTGVLDASTSVKSNAVFLEAGRPFTPTMFENVLNNFSPDVPNNMSGRPRQEDAQEFLSFIMDQVHDELLKLGGQFSSTTGAKSSVVSSTDDDDEWETVGPKNQAAVTRTQSFVPSELSDIFGGYLRSEVKARGNKPSATVQAYLMLHLDIHPEAVCTIEDALHLFSAPEDLEGYRASATGKAGIVSARKSIKIQKLSKIMILHLMRFSYGSQGSSKLHKPVHFPLELVLGRDLLFSSSTESRKYELVATITHHGWDPSKGHYTADARHQNGQWLRFDDASVTPIGTNKVLHDQAYVLFYKQV